MKIGRRGIYIKALPFTSEIRVLKILIWLNLEDSGKSSEKEAIDKIQDERQAMKFLSFFRGENLKKVREIV